MVISAAVVAGALIAVNAALVSGFWAPGAGGPTRDPGAVDADLSASDEPAAPRSASAESGRPEGVDQAEPRGGAFSGPDADLDEVDAPGVDADRRGKRDDEAWARVKLADALALQRRLRAAFP